MSASKFQVPDHLQSLVTAFTEMMTGEATEENIEIIIQWALYMHIRSIMPQIVGHWTQANPNEAAKVKETIKELQSRNEAWKAKRQQKEE